ncbi:MAG: ADOP family duplicated permease [Acidobacteriota bacterium]
MHLRDDLRYALRRLRHRPAFAAAALLTLALGLGANIAVFSLMHAALFRSLPVERPHELVRLGDTLNCCVNSGLQDSYSLFSTRLVDHLRTATADEFVGLAAFQATTQSVSVRRGAGAGQSIRGQYVSANYFRTFGVRPAAGRLLAPDDDEPNATPVVVLSYRTWMERYGGDPALIGDVLVVNGHPMTVAGVAAPDFFGEVIRPNPAGVWLPLGQEPLLRGETSLRDRPMADWLYAIGRLRPGATAERVAARASAALRQFIEAENIAGEEERDRTSRQHIVVTPAGSGVPLLREQFGRALTVLLITSGLVLLIAAANLANLMLATADRGQAAIRAALGAPASRVLSQALLEGVVLALIGGALAVWVATSGARALVTLAFPPLMVERAPVDTSPGAVVWMFAVGLALVTGLLFSAAPAWAMARTPPLEALQGIGRSGGVRAFVPRRLLVVVQVALTFVLLAGAGLLLGTLGALEDQALGFEVEGRTVIHIDPPPAADGEAQARRFTALRDAIARIPGVRRVSYALYSPMEGNNWSSRISLAGRAVDPTSPDISSWNRVGPDYFETTGTRVLRGRAITETDLVGGRRVAVVNDAFRRRFFPDAEVLGQHVGIGGPDRAGDYEIVGLVEDVRYTGPRQPVRPMIFLPAFQTVDYGDDAASASMQARSMQLRTLVVDAAVPAGALEAAVRQALAEVDREVTVARVVALADQVSVNFQIERLMARLTSLYGLLALGLAAIGLFGVTAFGVRQRTREIGLRIALGASRARVIRTVVAAPLRHTLVGLLVGVPAAVAGSRAISTLLYGVEAGDPGVYAAAAAALATTTAVAAFVPGWRATAIDPTDALRE